MPSIRRLRRFAATLLVVVLAAAAADPAAAEIVLVDEPFTLQTGAVTFMPELEVVWLPPGATADQAAGFLVSWMRQQDLEETIFRAFLPQQGSELSSPPQVVAGPGHFTVSDLTVAADRRSAVTFRSSDHRPGCYGGILYGPRLETEAALRPAEEATCASWGVEGTLLQDGRLVVVYRVSNGQFVTAFEAQFFAPDGEALGEPFRLDPGHEIRRLREVVATADGFLVFSAVARFFRPQFGSHELRVQHFDLQGQPLSEEVQLRDAPSLVDDVSIVRIGGGFIAVWEELAIIPGTTNELSLRAFARRLDATGAPAGPVQPVLADVDSSVLRSVSAGPGPGETVLLGWAEDTGQGSEVQAQLLTADLAAAGDGVTLATRAQSAFGPTLAASPAGDALAVWMDGEDTLLAQRLVVEGECTPSETVLCLQGGRFEVSVEWADFQGNSGPGRRVPVASDDSGLFWFFHPDNWEMLVKVLDACPLDGHFWVFAAAATNVEYALTVSDLVAHETRIFRNDLGDTARALTVTDAFPTCGAGGD